MAAHSATMEVLCVAGKVQYHETFNHKGLRDVRCMICTMVFDSNEVQKRHIISCHWAAFEATVSVSHINVANLCMEIQLQLHMHVKVYLGYLYMKICHFLGDVILFFLYIVEEGTGNSKATWQCQRKDKDDIMVTDKCRRQADVIY